MYFASLKNRIKKMKKEKKREKREREENKNDTTAAATIVCCMCGCVLFCPNEGGDICNSKKKEERKK
jgi:hypothetical protein